MTSTRPMTSAEERTMKLSLQEISAVFHMPLHEACVQLQADEPTLKKRYRELGINAWPYRKRYKFDDPNIESLVRNAMTRGRPKKLSPDTPKSPSLFGNFILSKKKSKKEEEEEKKQQFHGSTASPVCADEDAQMSEQNWSQQPRYTQPVSPQPQKYYSQPQYNTYPPQNQSTSYNHKPYYGAPQYDQHYQHNYYPQHQSSMHQQPQYPSYPMHQQSSYMPNQQQGNTLPSIQELLNTAPQPQYNQSGYGMPRYQQIKQEKEHKDVHYQDPRLMERGSYNMPRHWQ